MGRSVTIIRLSSGKLIIHSTAPFSVEDVSAISSLGEPGWLVEATNFHDTCAGDGVSAFPDLPYLVPPGFPGKAGANCCSLMSPPPVWKGEVDVIELKGMPRIREHAVFHRASGTLILADLFFNLPSDSGRWTRGFLRVFAGIRDYPDTSRLFKACIRDRDAFRTSLQRLIDLDFERIIVGHGDPILIDAKTTFEVILKKAGLF
jgi:hypothetical protein